MPKAQGRPETSLNSKLERSLTTYAVAAGAAGMGLLSVAQPSQAEIVYTPTHVEIGTGGVQLYQLDVDNNQSNDFFFGVIANTRLIEMYVAGNIYGNGVQLGSGSHQGDLLARARKSGGQIGPNKDFRNKTALIMAGKSSQSSLFGSWVNVKRRYLGLRFFIGQQDPHFGWARLNLHFGDGLTMHATLTGYAYETIPNKPIVAGDTGAGASLGHLALGAVNKGRAPVAGH